MLKFIHLISVIATIIFFVACSPDDTATTPMYSINGSVQKGQFIQGSSITIQELNDRLQPTGNSYQAQILDDMGTFQLSSDIKSRYVEIIANGYYFNEVTGKLSSAPLTLRAISDLASEGKSNVNILTSLELPRIKHMLLNQRITISEARKMAESEILRSFNIPSSEFSTLNGFDKLDIARAGINNAILLAISVTLQHNRSVAQLSEIISKIAADIEVNGQLKDETLLSSIRNNGMDIDAKQVSSNLEKRYNELSITGYAIPDFEDYLDINGNGIIDKLDNWFICNQDTDYIVDGASQTIEIEASSNFNYQFDIPLYAKDWIDIVATAQTIGIIPSTIKLNIAENKTGNIRYADINIQDTEGNIFKTISLKQLSNSGNIYFKDNNVFNILIKHGVDTNKDGQISYLEAYAIKSIDKWFSSHNGNMVPIKSFDELQYFIGLEQIDYLAFSGSELTYITLPSTIKRIGTAAFSGCPIQHINLPDGLLEIGDSAFGGCEYLTNINLPNTLRTIGTTAFSWCNIKHITIPESIETIGDGAFICCPNLIAFYGKYASEDNKCLIIDNTLNAVISNLTHFDIPQGIQKLESQVFESQHLLSSLNLPQSLTYISSLAFHDCSNLTTIVIPENVNNIEYYAFSYCPLLTNIYCKAITPPTAIKFKSGEFGQYQYWDAFENISPKYRIYVPRESVNQYKSADGWSDYADKIVGYDF